MYNPSNLAGLAPQSQEQAFGFSPLNTLPVMPGTTVPGYDKASQTIYKQTAVETASPEKLVVMLYNGATRFLLKGEKALLEERYEDVNESLSRALDIVNELNATLNMEAGGDVAVNLRDLYSFYAREIIAAGIKREAARLRPAIEFFEEFAKVWSEAARQV